MVLHNILLKTEMFSFATFPISGQNLTEALKIPAYAELNAEFPFKPIVTKLESYITLHIVYIKYEVSESK